MLIKHLLRSSLSQVSPSSLKHNGRKWIHSNHPRLYCSTTTEQPTETTPTQEKEEQGDVKKTKERKKRAPRGKKKQPGPWESLQLPPEHECQPQIFKVKIKKDCTKKVEQLIKRLQGADKEKMKQAMVFKSTHIETMWFEKGGSFLGARSLFVLIFFLKIRVIGCIFIGERWTRTKQRRRFELHSIPLI